MTPPMGVWVAWWLGWSWQPEAYLILQGDLKLLAAPSSSSSSDSAVPSRDTEGLSTEIP